MLAMTELQLLDMGTNSLQWFEEHRKEIQEEHDKEFVAIKEEKIIASGENMDILLEKLKEMSISSDNVFIRFVSKMTIIL